MPERILVVGLGEVARTHLDVLADMDDAIVVGGVDPVVRSARFRGRALPVFRSVADSAGTFVTLVVVATPTPTHAAVCDEIAATFPDVPIMVEKPGVVDPADARRLFGRPTLWVAYHLRYAPEVEWGVARAGDLGVAVRARSVFADPYAARYDEAAARFGSSWLDSGINALSVLDRFVELTERRSLRRIGPASESVYEGRFGADVLVVTSWHVTAPAKTTMIGYASGATLVLDHTAVAGYLFEDGRLTDTFGSDGTTDRRYNHYAALYRDVLSDTRPTGQDDLRLHELLLPAED